MLALANRWCDLSASVRFAGWLAMLFLISVVCVLSSPAPKRGEPDSRLQAHWRSLMSLPTALEALAPAKPVPFSALAFQRNLVSWQPAAAGGELTLEGEWQKLLAAFSQLAAGDSAVTGFSIQPEKANLRMTLQLEFLHE